MSGESSLKFCTVCASNNNRSMEAHKALKDAGFDVSSYGTGTAVRMPGKTVYEPVVYKFGKPYDDMYHELLSKDKKLYTSNGVLMMLDRNRKVKDYPERWHEGHKVFDVIFTCETRCFDSVCLDLMNRGAKLNKPVHVINVDIKDNYEEAIIGGKGILKLAKTISRASNLDEEIMDILGDWQDEHPSLPCLYELSFY